MRKQQGGKNTRLVTQTGGATEHIAAGAYGALAAAAEAEGSDVAGRGAQVQLRGMVGYSYTSNTSCCELSFGYPCVDCLAV